MSQALLTTKKRINSIESTKKITKAMQLVSSVKLKAQMKRLDGNTLFADQISHVVSKLFSSLEDFESPYFKKYDSEKKLFIIVTSNLGLCGSYNFNVFKLTDELICDKDDVIILGTKGQSHYKNAKFNIIHDFDEYDSGNVNVISKLLKLFCLSQYVTGKYKEINLLYTNYKNSITFLAKKQTLFPVEVAKSEEGKYEIEPLVEPSKSLVVENLIPIYVESIILSRLIESNVSEQASRRNAMDNATNNAQDLVDKLKLEYNKARQNSITSEIIEVVSASNNLQGGD